MATRPTPLSIALSALIALHNEEKSPLYQHGLIENDGHKGSSKVGGGEGKEEGNHEDVNTTASTQGALSDAFHKVDAFLQECLLLHHGIATSDHQENSKTTTTTTTTITTTTSNHHAWHSVHAERITSFMERFAHAGCPALVVQVFRHWLQIASSSIDTMMDLILSIRRSLREGSVDVASANGMFLRSVSLGFEELSFESTVKLWKDFHREMQECHDTSTPKKQEWTLSARQIEGALRQQCLRMEVASGRYAAVDHGTAQMQLQKILDRHPELPSAHFLRFLQCVQSGERVGAVDALHQYLDYAVIQETHQDEIMQFAAILKAALYHSVGDHRSSLEATEEAVRVAQQSQDAACVAFALGWLSIHSQNQLQNQPTVALMHRCVQRAVEGNLRTLSSGANFSMAFMATDHADPVSAWTHWMDSISEAPTSQAESPWDRPVNIAHLESGDQARSLMGRQQLIAAGIWDRFGQRALSEVASLTAIRLQGDVLAASDVEIAIQNVTRLTLFGASSNLVKDMTDSAVDERCIYATALLKMAGLRKANGLSFSTGPFFSFDLALVAHEWAVRRCDWMDAQALMSAMLSHLCPRLSNYEVLNMDILVQKCLLLSRQGRAEEAITIMKSLVQTTFRSGKRMHAISLLLQLALLYMSASQREFTNVLPTLLECLTRSKKYHMHGVHASALTLLADVHMRMGRYKLAMAVLKAALPIVLQQGHVWIQGQAFLILAKSRLLQAKALQASRSAQWLKRILRLTTKDLHKSEQLFRACQDVELLQEIYYLLAQTYHAFPDAQTERNDASKRFAYLSRYKMIIKSPTLPLDWMNSLSDDESALMTLLASRTCPSELAIRRGGALIGKGRDESTSPIIRMYQ